jgi:hypothetical protein
MLNLVFRGYDTPSPPAGDELYPNSILPTIDPSFLRGLIVEDPPPSKSGFWRRQFAPEVTAKQTAFDWLFGLIMPAICFYFDFFVFRSRIGGEALLGRYQLPAYLISGLAIMSTVTWLLWGSKLGPLNSLFAALFAISGAIALIIGIVLFPFSVVGMFFLIGFLGFTPLFTSFVLFRNAVRAYRMSL